MTKLCRDCGEEKALSEFSPSSKNVDGRTSYCRPCMRRRSVRYRDNALGEDREHRRPAVPGQKFCSRCQRHQSMSAFGRNATTADGLTTYCRPCHNAAGREALERKGGARDYHLRRRYGLTSQRVDELIAAQGGLCAVCKVRPPEHVDHDHKTGRVRGVLCSGCNQGLGNFRDDTAALRAAIDYLET